MDEITARVKRWGSSLGLVIPADVVKRNGIAPGDAVLVRIEPVTLRMKDITGFLADELKDLDWAAAERELATGWDND